MSFTRRHQAFLWLPAVSALVLNTPQDLTTPSANPSLDSVLGAAGLNLTTIMNQSEKNEASVYCERGAGHQYGSPELMSCANALENIPKSTILRTFGRRGTEIQGANGLPCRFISSDGDCIIDIDYIGRMGNTDMETYSKIARTAELILFDCVFEPGGVRHGGIAAGLGAQGELTVTMQQYYPRVECWPPTTPSRALNATACQILLYQMLTTTSSQIFGKRGAPGVEVPLTQRFSSANGDCSIALLIDGPPVPLTWYEIWGAAVAVAGMCVPAGKLGTAIVQSEDSTISVAFGRAFVKKACVAKRRLSDQGPTHRSAGKVVKHKVFNRYKLNETSRDLDEYIREVKGLNGI